MEVLWSLCINWKLNFYGLFIWGIKKQLAWLYLLMWKGYCGTERKKFRYSFPILSLQEMTDNTYLFNILISGWCLNAISKYLSFYNYKLYWWCTKLLILNLLFTNSQWRCDLSQPNKGKKMDVQLQLIFLYKTWEQGLLFSS